MILTPALAPLNAAGATRPVQLTRSGGYIDDAVRAATTGEPPTGMTSIYPATVNRITDPRGKTVAQWTGTGCTVAAVTGETVAPYPLITTALKLTFDGTGAAHLSQNVQNALTAGSPYGIRVCLKGEGATIGKTARIIYRMLGGASGNADSAQSTALVLTGAYQEITLVGVTVDFSDRTTVRWDVRLDVPANLDVVYATAMQATESAVALPLCIGSFSNCSWAGTADASTSSRTAGRVQVPWDAGLYTPSLGSIAMLFRAGFPITTSGLNPTLFAHGADNNNGLRLDYVGATNIIQLRRANAGSSGSKGATASAHAVGDYIFATAVWTPTTLSVSRNGEQGLSSVAADTNIPALSGSADIGGNANIFSGRELAGDDGWTAFFSRALTNSDDLNLRNAFGKSTSPKPTLRGLIQLCPGAHPTELWDGRTGIAQRRVAA